MTQMAPIKAGQMTSPEMTQMAPIKAGQAHSSGAGYVARRSVGQSLYTRHAQYYAALERRVTLAINADGQKSKTG